MYNNTSTGQKEPTTVWSKVRYETGYAVEVEVDRNIIKPQVQGSAPFGLLHGDSWRLNLLKQNTRETIVPSVISNIFFGVFVIKIFD